MSDSDYSTENSPVHSLTSRPLRCSSIPLNEAFALIEKVRQEHEPEPRTCPVSALEPGRVLAERIAGRDDDSKFGVATADGFACASSDGSGVRRIVGQADLESAYLETIQKMECVQISAGARIPNGADSIIERENVCLEAGHDESYVKLLIPPVPGTNISRSMPNSPRSDFVLDYGCQLNAAEIGLLNSLGVQDVEIFRKPRVCVISIGNQLVEPYEKDVPAGFQRDSNRSQLLALFRQQGFRAIDAGLCLEDPNKIEQTIRTAAIYATMIVTSGGLSSEKDTVLNYVLQTKLNLKVEFGQVWMREGTPCVFAHGRIDGVQVIVFALPTYPVDTLTCAHLFVSPFLRGLAGHSKTSYTVIQVKLAEDMEMLESPDFVGAWLESKTGEQLPIANLTGSKVPSRSQSLVSAQVLLILPPKSARPTLLRGDVVDAMIISGL